MTPTVPESPDRFEPSLQQREKQGKSASKRIALFIFVGAGIIFTLVAMSILNSGDGLKSGNAPVNLFEASRGAESITPPKPKPPEPPEPEPEPAPVPLPKQIQPMYIPVPTVSTRRKQAQVKRLMAAGAPTSIQAFRMDGKDSSKGTAGAGSHEASAALAEVSKLLADIPAPQDGQGASSFMPMPPDMGAGGPGGNASDPNGWNRKEAFIKQNLPEEYSQHIRATPRSPLELKSGTLLPCVLISGLNSDLPGNMVAQISENVWDTVSGRYLLIPRGSKVIGTYDNQVAYGQSRILVIWSRLVFPDRTSGASPALHPRWVQAGLG